MKHKVRLDLEPWELMALDPLTHWCHRCLRMHEFRLDERDWSWYNEACGKRILAQQLIIEGVLIESKYRGIEAS